MAFLNEVTLSSGVRASGTALSLRTLASDWAGSVAGRSYHWLAAARPGTLRILLAFCSAGIFAVFTIGALSVPETRGQLDSPTRPDREFG